MAFGSFIGGIIICAVAVLFGVFGLAILTGLYRVGTGNETILTGVAVVLIALLLFAYGWYSYNSAKPRGTIKIET